MENSFKNKYNDEKKQLAMNDFNDDSEISYLYSSEPRSISFDEFKKQMVKQK